MSSAYNDIQRETIKLPVDVTKKQEIVDIYMASSCVASICSLAITKGVIHCMDTLYMMSADALHETRSDCIKETAHMIFRNNLLGFDQFWTRFGLGFKLFRTHSTNM